MNEAIFVVLLDIWRPHVTKFQKEMSFFITFLETVRIFLLKLDLRNKKMNIFANQGVLKLYVLLNTSIFGYMIHTRGRISFLLVEETNHLYSDEVFRIMVVKIKSNRVLYSFFSNSHATLKILNINLTYISFVRALQTIFFTKSR